MKGMNEFMEEQLVDARKTIAEQAATIKRLQEFISGASYDDYWVQTGGDAEIAAALTPPDTKQEDNDG